MDEYDDEELELSDEQIARNDEIDNAVFGCIATLAEDPEMEWDMEIIGETTDAIKGVLFEYGISVRHPGIVELEDGTEFISEYENVPYQRNIPSYVGI